MATKSLAQYLKDHDITQTEFGEKAELTQAAVSRIVNGGDCLPRVMRKIYKVTNGEVTPNWLVLNQAA